MTTQTEAQRLSELLCDSSLTVHHKAAALLCKQDELLRQALELIECQRAWIAAVPQEIPLPAMPGFDWEWGRQAEESIRNHLEAK